MLRQVALILFTFAYIPLLTYACLEQVQWKWQKLDIFTLHPLLMLLTFALSAHSINAMYSKHVLQKKKLADTHAQFSFGALISAVGAFVAVEYVKFVYSYQHFKSWHGILGSVCVGYFLIQASGGFFAHNFPQKMLPMLKMSNMTFSDLWTQHRLSGGLFISLLFTVECLGIFTHWIDGKLNFLPSLTFQGFKLRDHFINIGLVLMSLIWFGSVVQVFIAPSFQHPISVNQKDKKKEK